MAPVLRPAGVADDALVLVDATSGAGGLPVDLDRGRRLLLRAAEVLRLRRRALDRADVAAPRSSAPRRSRASDRHVPAFFDLPTAIDNSAQEPDLQHPVGRHALPDGRAARLDEQPGRAQGHGRAHDRQLGRALRLGGADVVHDAVRRRAGRPLAGDRHHRLRRLDRRRRDRRQPCAPTASSTPSPTASSAATSCGSRCTPRSTRPTSRRSPPHRPRGRRQLSRRWCRRALRSGREQLEHGALQRGLPRVVGVVGRLGP